ncbi:hypothetical protein GCM10010425_03540 [Streptomyces spororaveus]|uniref:Uncharacterized protein n=1 Tax=Streptomyces spororaveus TaxID=284039 RepID=A0ABQ3TD72_9ACTN|nr:hypothetical protein [Streptomyces spororaveus]GHI78372.1 hypothetical protein Sspor_39330 [Streptomyces spororaveus]
MSTPKAWPDLADKAALREWMVARRDDGVRPPARTMAELRARQLQKISRTLRDGVDPEPSEQPRRPILQFALDGESVPGHKVEAGVLGTWLEALQTAVHSVAYALDEMRPTHQAGPVPKGIQAATKLLAGPVFASSYGMVLEGSATPGQRELPGTGNDQLLDRAINRILDVADEADSASGAEEAVLDAALPLGRRAISHLAELSEILASTGTNVTFTWQSEATERRVSRLTTSSADHCRKALRSAQVEDSTDRLTGTVVGGSKIRGVIELETSGRVVLIRTQKDAVTQLLATYAERQVSADVHVLTARSPGGREHHSYTLLNLDLNEPESER